LKNQNFLKNYLKKPESLRKFALKNRFFVCEIALKNLNFSEIFLENRNFLTRSTTRPDFKPDWRRWVVLQWTSAALLYSVTYCAHY